MADVLTPGAVMMMTDTTPKPMDENVPPCEYAVVIGSTECAYEIALALFEMGWNPVILATNEIIPSYWTDCTALQADAKLQKLQELRTRVMEKKIRIVPNNWIQDVEYAGAQYEVFAVKSLQYCVSNSETIHNSSTLHRVVAMSLVLCSENEIRKYKAATKQHRGMFVCAKEKDVPKAIEDVCFHLTMVTGQLRSELVERSDKQSVERIPKVTDSISENITSDTPLPKKKLCCC